MRNDYTRVLRATLLEIKSNNELRALAIEYAAIRGGFLKVSIERLLF